MTSGPLDHLTWNDPFGVFALRMQGLILLFGQGQQVRVLEDVDFPEQVVIIPPDGERTGVGVAGC